MRWVGRARLGVTSIACSCWRGWRLPRSEVSTITWFSARGSLRFWARCPSPWGSVVVAYLGARELVPKALPHFGDGRLSFLPSLPPPPSLRAMRDALRKAERPVMLHWIGLGALVTMGVIITCVVERSSSGGDWGSTSARSTKERSPARFLSFSSASACSWLSRVGLFGRPGQWSRQRARSSAFDRSSDCRHAGHARTCRTGCGGFRLAFAPIAFGLACAGAWIGIGGAHG